MNGDDLRRLLTDEELEHLLHATGTSTSESLRRIIDRLADAEHAFEAAPEERERIAALAASFLEGVADHEDAALRLRHARGDWRERAEAADELIARGTWTPAHLFGTPSVKLPSTPASRMLPGLDVAAARSLAIAIRETLLPGVRALQNQLHGPAAMALRDDATDGEADWESALRPLVGHYARNARAVGASRQAAVLKALAGIAVLKGEALCAEERHRATACMLGSAASVVLKNEPREATGKTQAVRALMRAVAMENEARLLLWEGYDLEEVWRFGAAAAMAAFGRGCSSASACLPTARATVAFRLPETWRVRFSHVAAEEAIDPLERIAADPRTSETERLMAEALVEVLRAHPAPERVSFSDALGIEPAELRVSALKPGREVFRAGLAGAFSNAFVCRGARGRLLRCRAAVNADGAVVGYLAFDPLSRELGGTPLYALYDLDGHRYGYARMGDSIIVRLGLPPEGFATAPESIPVSKKSINTVFAHDA